jgi:AraC-like DNA-binding protein
MFEGQKVLHLFNKDINAQKDNIIFLSQGQYFMSEMLGDINIFKSTLIYFDNQFIIDFIKKYDLPMNNLTSKSEIILKNDKFVQNISSSFELYIENNFENKNKIMKLKTEEILLHLYNKNKNELLSYFKNILNSQHDTLKFTLESNLDEINSIKDLCALTRLNSANLRKQMLKEYGLFPKEWLNERRLSKATLLLQNTSQSITQIANNCNYATCSWFISQFKKKYNETPKQYRDLRKTT